MLLLHCGYMVSRDLEFFVWCSVCLIISQKLVTSGYAVYGEAFGQKNHDYENGEWEEIATTQR